MRPDAEVIEDERLEGGVDGHDPLSAALSFAYAEQAALEVDILPVEPEQFAAA